MPQHVRGEPAVPAWQVPARRLGQRRAQRIRPQPAGTCIGLNALGREQGSARPGVVVAELAPHVLDEPAQRPARSVDQRDHPLARPGPARALAIAHVHLPERPQLPLHIRQVQAAHLVGAQPDLGHEPGRRVVPGRRRELAARRQLTGPSGEQPRHLLFPGRNPQPGVLGSLRPVHLIDRAGHHPAGQRVQLSLVAQLQEREPGHQRACAGMPGPAGRLPHHRPEVGIGVGRLHLPQRAAEPLADLLQVADLAADRAVRQACRGPCQHEPRQQVGFVIRKLLGAGGAPHFPQVPHHRQARTHAPALHKNRSYLTITEPSS